MNPSRTTAAAIAAAAVLALASCGKTNGPQAPASTPSSSPPQVAAAAPSSSPSSPARPQSTTVPSVPTRKADKPSRKGLPKKVRRRDVRDLAERFAKAWTTLEFGKGDPAARRELAATIDAGFAAEIAQMQLAPREDPAKLKGVDVIQHPGGKRRWTAVVRLVRHGATEYLQAEIARKDGRLVVTGMSW